MYVDSKLEMAWVKNIKYVLIAFITILNTYVIEHEVAFLIVLSCFVTLYFSFMLNSGF